MSAGEKACRGYNRCPAVFCTAVPGQLYQSVQNKVCMCEPALCTLLTGSSRSPVMMETYYLVRCSAVSHRDKGKWRQVLWSAVYVRGIGFACRIFSITFPFSSPLLSLFLPVVLYPLASSQRAARCHPWISLPLIHQILWHKIKPKKIDQI